MILNSVHSDRRGTIHCITDEKLGHPEVTVFFTKNGLARGGCIHNQNDEFACVISGKIEYVIGDDIYDLEDGDSVLIPKGTPHFFRSLTDSVVLEWGATEEEKKKKHEEYRSIVEDINDSTD